MKEPQIDGGRVVRELTELARFSESQQDAEQVAGETAVTRVVFTQHDREARAYLRALAEDAGLAVRVDAIGNTFFRWQGSEPELPAVATGSHIDAIPNAGMYDGTVGVLGGLEAIRALQAAGFMPRRSLELILFTSEEPTRFGIGCLGSRMLAGRLSAEAAAALQDAEGASLDSVRTAAGFTGSLAGVALEPGVYVGFVELHIEQGPELEREGIAIAAVTAIAAPASASILIAGEGGHAGAMLMPRRHDALVAAGELIVAVEAAARGTGALDTVATVGMCDVFPGAVNSVPSRVRLSLDVRDVDEARRDRVLEEITAAGARIAAARGVKVSLEMLNRDAPARCAPRLIEQIQIACAATRTPGRPMVSRAYHDSLFMAKLCPIAMIFIPCRNGVSHRPDEFSTPSAIATGIRILALTLRGLSLLEGGEVDG